MKQVFILRGVPSAGKTTVAKSITKNHFEADHFFYNDKGEYCYDVKKQGLAHEVCYRKFVQAVDKGLSKICVSNTFTTSIEFHRYKEYAESKGYLVHCLIVERRHENLNSHNVPAHIRYKMKERFQICID
jgi:adenylate kinase family enzyme